MVIVVGSLILIRVSMVSSIASAWRLAREMTTHVSFEEVCLRRWEMMYAPSGVGRSAGDVWRKSGMVMLSEER